jgi:hypothetical protein
MTHEKLTTMYTQTQNTYKTWALLQTTGGKAIIY